MLEVTMPKKKRESSKQPSVRVGNISDISGNMNVAGGNITTHHTTAGLSLGQIKQLFEELYAEIEAHPKPSPSSKEDIKAEVQEIETIVTQAAQKNEKVDEGFLTHRFRNIARMAPDVLDLVVAMLANPLAGLGVAIRKIAEKAEAVTIS
jgi:hypothetical protein